MALIPYHIVLKVGLMTDFDLFLLSFAGLDEVQCKIFVQFLYFYLVKVLFCWYSMAGLAGSMCHVQYGHHIILKNLDVLFL